MANKYFVEKTVMVVSDTHPDYYDDPTVISEKKSVSVQTLAGVLLPIIDHNVTFYLEKAVKGLASDTAFCIQYKIAGEKQSTIYRYSISPLVDSVS